MRQQPERRLAGLSVDDLLALPPARFRTLAEMHPGDFPEAAILD
ncbi:hypothetical protein EDC65_3265 [Stella humosa]|uniref:Uncharacterized protein n=1 Tax=Stella humosa TaxID=94 RepID=A0A3N1LKJ8_9PROT|nr:hypothetical protein [Stella humosa]ROP91398.1 hypothetical protein EDC65_3265 [Stella humosa]BBK34242.1 hypothetical protein STHU_48760 [Stella humosa]